MRKLDMAESKTTAKKPAAKKPAAKKEAPKKDSNALIKMIRDDGVTADVHPSMVQDYKSGGYKEA
jgi:hypothetical protein